MSRTTATQQRQGARTTQRHLVDHQTIFSAPMPDVIPISNLTCRQQGHPQMESNFLGDEEVGMR